MKQLRTGAIVLLLLLLAVPVAGHVPSFPDGNTTPERALDVHDAAKSWSFYDSLDDSQAKYYRLSVRAGQHLRISTFTPNDGVFTPSIVVMGTTIQQQASVPSTVTVPDGMGTVTIAGSRPEKANYEPFAPSAYYQTARYDREVETDSTYLVAIYEPANRSGKVGVAIGSREEFSPSEYLRVPFDLVQTHLWEGQHPLLALGPWAVTVLGGASLFSRTRTDDWEDIWLRYGLAFGGLALAGTGVNTTVQMALALSKTGATAGALVTGLFIAVPAIAGAWTLHVGTREDLDLPRRTRGALTVAAGLGILTWAGFLVGPLVILVVAAVPASVRKE